MRSFYWEIFEGVFAGRSWAGENPGWGALIVGPIFVLLIILIYLVLPSLFANQQFVSWLENFIWMAGLQYIVSLPIFIALHYLLMRGKFDNYQILIIAIISSCLLVVSLSGLWSNYNIGEFAAYIINLLPFGFLSAVPFFLYLKKRNLVKQSEVLNKYLNK